MNLTVSLLVEEAELSHYPSRVLKAAQTAMIAKVVRFGKLRIMSLPFSR